jgi:hypothetical protein
LTLQVTDAPVDEATKGVTSQPSLDSHLEMSAEVKSPLCVLSGS